MCLSLGKLRTSDVVLCVGPLLLFLLVFRFFWNKSNHEIEVFLLFCDSIDFILSIFQPLLCVLKFLTSPSVLFFSVTSFSLQHFFRNSGCLSSEFFLLCFISILSFLDVSSFDFQVIEFILSIITSCFITFFIVEDSLELFLSESKENKINSVFRSLVLSFLLLFFESIILLSGFSLLVQLLEGILSGL